MGSRILISTITVGSGGASSIDFTSIPSTYTDLVIKLSLRTNGAGVDDYALVKFNSDTGSNYPYKQLYGNGGPGNVISNGGTLTSAALVRLNGGGSTSNTFGSNDIYIPNYAGNTQKSASADGVSENNGSTATASLWASGWTGTAAITALTITPAGGNFVQYSTASLYGIKSS